METEDFPRGPEPAANDPADVDETKRKRPRLREPKQGLPPTSIDLTSDLHFDECPSAGSKAFGMVTEVSNSGLRVSLAHGVEAAVSPEDTSDLMAHMIRDSEEGRALKEINGGMSSMTDIFTPGQFVRGTWSVENDDHCKFSLSPELFYDKISASSMTTGSVVVGVIRSVEDHGYALSFGSKAPNGFLHTKEAVKHLPEGEQLLPGQLVDCLIDKRSPSGVLQMSIDREKIKIALRVESNSFGSQIPLPGDMVYATITRIARNGMLATFMSSQEGLVSLFHLPQDFVGPEWQKDYVVGQTVKARILGWHPDRAQYLLSLKPFLLNLELPRMPAVIGQTFSEATVHRSDSNGLYLRLPTNPWPLPCYVFAPDLGDLPLASSDFKLGQTVPVRVTGFHAMEGLVVGSMKQSVISSGVIGFEDIYPGMVGEGTVVKAFQDRVYVSVGERVDGIARQCGLSADIPLDKVYRKGQIVSYRVLKLKPETRTAVLSLDSGLVQSSLPFLSSWEDAVVNQKVIGYILAIKERCLVIGFAGEVYGILPASFAKVDPGQRLQDSYRKHQVMKIFVKECDPLRKRIILVKSKSQLDPSTKRTTQKSALADVCIAPPSLSPGDVLTGKVVKELRSGEGYLVALESESGGIIAKALLQWSHISDHRLGNRRFQEEESAGQVIVLETSPFVKVSRKKSLIQNSATLPRSLEDLKETMLAFGFVSFISDEFLSVSFLAGLTGRVFKNATPVPAASISSQFTVGQSVQTRVIKVDLERKRFNLSLIPSRIPPSDVQFLEDAFGEIATAIPRKRVGDVVDATVLGASASEIECSFDGGVQGIVPADHFSQEIPQKGSTAKACILDIGQFDQAVLSLKQYLVERGFASTKKLKRKRKSKKEDAGDFEGVIELIRDSYLVVSLPEQDHDIVFVSTSDYNFQGFELSKAFQLGQRIKVQKDNSRSGSQILSTPLAPLLWHKAVRKGIAGVSKNQLSDFKVGDKVEGAIERIEDGGVRIKLDSAPDLIAVAELVDLFDKFTDQLRRSIDQGVRCSGIVIKIDDKRLVLSLRPSEGGRLDRDVAFLDQDVPIALTRDQIERGDTMWGYVGRHGKSTQCLIVNIAREMYATIFHPHFSDDPLQDIYSKFPVGTLIKGTIISCNYPKVGLSLRSGNKPLDTIGATRKGTITNILPQGVYIQLEGSNLQGLVPRYDLEPGHKGLKKGSPVSVRIHPLTDAFHLLLALDASEEKAAVSEESDAIIELDESEDEDVMDFETALVQAVKDRNPATEYDVSPVESRDRSPSLWNDSIRPLAEPTVPEAETAVKEETRPPSNDNPRTADDFERLLFSDTSCSFVWIRYMSYYQEQGDMAKARAIAERALTTINFRKEKERMDVWLAYLNLERAQGRDKDFVMALFHRAVLCNDVKQLHLRFLKVLQEERDTEVGDLVAQSLRKRCPTSAKAAIHELEYWLVTGRGGRCKKILDSALRNLPKKKHVKVAVKSGVLEFKYGEVERGREIFEGLIAFYPKRTDLWNVYLDQELLKGDNERARALFERASSIDANRKKMKAIFKRYLQFEVQNGSSETVEHVKKKARDYVNQRNV